MTVEFSQWKLSSFLSASDVSFNCFTAVKWAQTNQYTQVEARTFVNRKENIKLISHYMKLFSFCGFWNWTSTETPWTGDQYVYVVLFLCQLFEDARMENMRQTWKWTWTHVMKALESSWTQLFIQTWTPELVTPLQHC